MSNGIEPRELIAQYCDLNAVYQAVFHKKYAAAAAQIDQAMQQIVAEQTDPEDLSIITNCFRIVMQYDIFYRLLDEIGCDLGDTYEDRAAMREEYESWKATGVPGDIPWLSQTHSAVKIRLFKAIDALSLSVTDFDDIPRADIRIPRTNKKTYGEFEMVTIADAEITDDDGFSAAENPIGKSFTFQDSDGIIYHLQNIRRSKVPGGLHLEGGRHYAADGWIEGYTGDTPREIEFETYRTEDGGIAYIFSYSTEGTNDNELPPDPRWAEYEAWIAHSSENRRAAQERFLAKYLQKG